MTPEHIRHAAPEDLLSVVDVQLARAYNSRRIKVVTGRIQRLEDQILSLQRESAKQKKELISLNRRWNELWARWEELGDPYAEAKSNG